MSDSDKGQLINDMLADMCGLIVKTIALIPPEHDDARLSACAFVLDQINEAVERMVRSDRTELHPLLPSLLLRDGLDCHLDRCVSGEGPLASAR